MSPKKTSPIKSKGKNQVLKDKKDTPKKKQNTPNQLNILDALSPAESTLERIRLDENETALIPFTQKAERVTVHFCDEAEIRDYIQCLGGDCLLCRIGKKSDDRLLLPVYVPAARYVAVLPVSTSLRPRALLPQLSSCLKAEKPAVAFVSRQGAKFIVSTNELPPGADAGEGIIKKFMEDYDAKKTQLTSVFQRLENEQLAEVPAIAEMAKLKGIDIS